MCLKRRHLAGSTYHGGGGRAVVPSENDFYFSSYFQISNLEGAAAHFGEVYIWRVLKRLAGKRGLRGLDMVFLKLRQFGNWVIS